MIRINGEKNQSQDGKQILNIIMKIILKVKKKKFETVY